MEESALNLRAGETALSCRTVLLVPETALSEAGHIKMFSVNSGPQTKHEFHALAQTALVRFQDRELAITPVTDPIRINGPGEAEPLVSGMAICRDLDDHLHVLAHAGPSQRKLLQAAHRFCTRWIRLDL